ncbi:MAG: lactonase family protein [Chitinophagaceae bacterium]|nr:lactonase family protein [Chitinophagaceae bacterium]
MKNVSVIIMLLLFQTGFAQDYYLLAGTYTKTNSKGIYVYTFDSKTGIAKPVSNIFTDNPSYLAIDQDGKHVYAVNEMGGGKGAVSSFSFDKKNGTLHFINNELTNGDDPCFIDLDATGKWIAAANYSGGNFTVFPVKSDGSVGAAAQTIQHTGSSVNKDRQEKPHVHSTVFSTDNRFLVVVDLGMDKITVYPFDASKEKPVTDEPVELNTPAGSGPRHILLNPSKPFAYLISELSGNITVYDYGGDKIDSIQTISSYPADVTGEKGSAAIHFSPDGKFLYASNREGSNTISIFSVDEATGKLTSLGFSSTGGDQPRDFTIDPTGNFLLAGNVKSDNIIIFNRDIKTGLLKNSGKKITIPQPTRLLFTHIK